MRETDFEERRDGEWELVHQLILTREDYWKMSREWLDGAPVKEAWTIADGQRRVRSWEF